MSPIFMLQGLCYSPQTRIAEPTANQYIRGVAVPGFVVIPFAVHEPGLQNAGGQSSGVANVMTRRPEVGRALEEDRLSLVSCQKLSARCWHIAATALPDPVIGHLRFDLLLRGQLQVASIIVFTRPSHSAVRERLLTLIRSYCCSGILSSPTIRTGHLLN